MNCENQTPQMFSDRLRSAREAKHYSQSKLSIRSGVTQASISQYERRQGLPLYKSLCKLADALGMTPEDLRGDAYIKQKPGIDKDKRPATPTPKKPQTFGERLIAARESKRHTRAELAELVGLTTPMIHRYEVRNVSPRAKCVVRLADALDVTADYLLHGTEVKPEPPTVAETPEEQNDPEAAEEPSVAETIEPPPPVRRPRVASETIYIAGPMRGMIDLNWPAFDQAERDLRERGLGVVNPVTLDREAGITLDTVLTDEMIRQAIMRDLNAIEASCDGIALLSGWHKSLGSKAEAALGKFLNIPVNPLWWWLQISRTKLIVRHKARYRR